MKFIRWPFRKRKKRYNPNSNPNINKDINKDINHDIEINLPQNHDDNDPPEQTMASLTFSILENGNTHIHCQWDDDMIAPTYGELLYRVNNGDFTDEIISILVNYAQDMPQDAPTIEEIIGCWQVIKEGADNIPLINPSNVFAIAEQHQAHQHMSEMDE